MSSKSSPRRRHGFFRSEPVLYAGLAVARDRMWWHRVFGLKRRRYADIPSYEAALIGGLEAHARPGAHIVVVGAGIGVTVVNAARLAGPSGRVTVYEGSLDCIDLTRETLARNPVEARVDLIHATVGEDVSVYESRTKASVLPATELPECDILELDCEGSEINILSEMKIRPPVILVETHGFHGAPTATVQGLLSQLGYGVTDRGVAEPHLAAFCEEHDIRVLEARRYTSETD